MMNEDKIYDLMDWAEIEAIVYSEHDNPHNLLGAHITDEGILIQAFMPSALKMSVKVLKTNKVYEMTVEDDEGYFATLLPGKRIPEYVYIIEERSGEIREAGDPYIYEPQIDAMDLNRFENGIHYDIYNKLGAHVTEIKGVSGTYFAVWAPNALRVSVVGQFNQWDGRVHQMRRLGESGIFELFIPGVTEGALYKYEIKLHGDITFLKTDPYGFGSEVRPDNANIVYDLESYQWHDSTWLKARKKWDAQTEPMAIYELHLGSWKKKEYEAGEKEFYNYRELAPMIAEYVKKMNYTHIELMPVMEHPLDESWGYQVTGYYAVTSRYGTPEDFMYFMDYMHQNGIGVILDWVPAHFPKDNFALANYDGSCLYENPDPRRGEHPHWGTLIFDFGKPQVNNFLLGSAFFWLEKYHADGLRIDAVASMLYLDYGRMDGDWLPNIYGGNENLEVTALFKQLTSLLKKKKDGAILIAEESTAWPMVTGAVEEDGLGFDFKWNMGWMNDFLKYMQYDPLFRKAHHDALTFSMVYQYSENFVLTFSHDEVTHAKGSMISKMYGAYDQKFANLRVSYGFMMAHPGKKLLFMGQDFAQFDEWNEKEGLQWELMERYESHKKLNQYVKSLNRFYQDYRALYAMDNDPAGFEWINNMDGERSILSFLRKTEKEDETLLIVCNFTPVVYQDFQIGVPFKGKYKETFNSDREEFGGQGYVNPRLKQSKAEECDERENSIRITVPPLGITVFTCTPVVNKTKVVKKEAKKAETPKKTVVKKSAATAVKKKAAATKDKKAQSKAMVKEEASIKEEFIKKEEQQETKEKLKTERKGVEYPKASTVKKTVKADKIRSAKMSIQKTAAVEAKKNSNRRTIKKDKLYHK